MKIGFIGDVHGVWEAYERSVAVAKANGAELTLQVGDFGVGFGSAGGQNPTRSFLSPHELNCRYGPYYRPYQDETTPRTDFFIRGNHDNPAVCKMNPLWVPDGSVWNNVFCVGGALSIDASMRTLGWDFWEDEELSYQELDNIINTYAVVRPDYVVSHDCPESVAQSSYHFYDKNRFPSRTREALQAMFEIHQPKLWAYGHWHISRHMVYNNTHFVGLGIDQVLVTEVK